MDDVCIVGWAHSPFGKLEDPDVESLIGRVAGAAIENAGVQAAEIDGVFVGNFNSGFSKQDFPSSLPMQSLPDLRFKPAARYENACASGSAAIFAARDFINAGRGRLALVCGGGEDDRRQQRPGRRQSARRVLPQGGGRYPRRFRRRVRAHCRDLFPALRRPIGRAGDDCRQEPQEWRGQSVRADAPGSGLRFLPQHVRKEPHRRRPAKADGLLPGERRWRRR